MEAQNRIDTSNGFVQLIKHIGTEVVVGNYSSNLSALERIFYVVILTHYQLNKARAVEISAEVWAKHLGIIDCDVAQLRSKILRVQGSFECKGFLQVIRRKNVCNRHMRNKIIPLISDTLCQTLQTVPSRCSKEKQQQLKHESNLDWVIRTKLFVPIKWNYLKQIFKDIFRSHSCKLFLLCSYISAYKNYQTIGKLFCVTINPRRTLKSYYPISQVEVDSMNKKSHKEFSLNFANQLLLKLISKYPHKTFPTWYHFNSYMTQAFKYELHQSINVNRQSFRFSCNIANESSYTDDHKIELYLSQIDHVFQQNHYSSINQKIGGRYV